MVMMTASVFLVNLFCSLVPCEPNFGDPQVPSGKHDGRLKTRSHTVPGLTSDGYLDPPVVQTYSGAMEGYLMKIINGRRIYAFEGVPYAEAPVGHLRFQNPIPKTPWEGIHKAKKPGPFCLQFHLLKIARITGSEDCLSMNIYTPTLPSPINTDGTNPVGGLPVIFWIHGGGGWFGAGSEAGPSYLLQEDVVLVTINYRLGILGFMSTGDEETPGNYGLKDQSLALKWVSENIHKFGGNPSKIIAMGVSSGAVFAHLLTMSPLTKHLVSGVISLSGTGLNHWAVSSPSKVERLKRRLADNLRCPTDTGSRALMDCVRSMNPNFLIIAQRRLFDFFVFPAIIYHAVVEKPGPGAFLTDTPQNLYTRNEVANVPFIASQSTDEAVVLTLLYNNTGTVNLLLKNFDGNAQDILDYRYIARNATETTELIKRYYMGTESNYNSSARPTLEQATEMVTTRFFRVGIHRSLQFHSRIAPTYGMRFGFKSEVGYVTIWGQNPEDYGVGHSTDSGFYFNSSSVFKPLKIGTPSYDVSRMMINMFANFAYTGEPYIRYRNGQVSRPWKPVTHPQDVSYLLVDNNNVVTIPEPKGDDIRFWESLGLPDTSANPFFSQETKHPKYYYPQRVPANFLRSGSQNQNYENFIRNNLV